jgi:flagellar protein FlaG
MGLEIPGIVPSGLYTDVKAKTKLQSRHTALKANRDNISTAPPLDIDIRETLKNLEKIISQFNRRFEFVVNENIDRIIVKVIDKQTDKVIKEIPPKEIQHLLAILKETVGLLVNEKI